MADTKPTTCSVPDCDRPRKPRFRFCESHAWRFYQYGDVNHVHVRRKRPDVERFLRKVNKSGPTPHDRPDLGPCWLWTGARDPKGYGRFALANSGGLAHRASWVLFVGPIPDATPHVCHECDNPSCVRPDHLYLGTRTDNMADAASKGRIVTPFSNPEWRRRHATRKGDQIAQAKLTPDIVREMRRRVAAGESMNSMARIFGVHKTVASRAIRRLTWSHVD